MGRPTILNQELINKLCGYISRGNYLETAANACNIDDSTIRKWRIKGQTLLDGDSVTDIDQETADLYITFVTAIKKARAESESRDLEIISRAAERSWQAAAWKLERTIPDRYGQKTRTDVTIKEPLMITTRRIERKEKDAVHRPGETEGSPAKVNGEG